MRKMIEVKKWFIDKTQETASRYNCYINLEERDENTGMAIERDGFVKVLVDEEIAESEKAIKVRLATGEIQGSFNGWEAWIPKSCVR